MDGCGCDRWHDARRHDARRAGSNGANASADDHERAIRSAGRAGAGRRVGSSGKGSSARELLVTRRGFPCKPQTYVNGFRWEEGVNLDGINTADILGFEFYTPATTPWRYNMTGSRERNAACGTVVFWLK